MTSHDRVGQAASLRSGYLLETPGQAELDERGCFSQRSMAEVERLVLESMAPAISEFDVPELAPVHAEPADRWRLASCLQKAIRFGMPEVAMAAANGLCTSDRAYALRRLGVILVEDVMGGSPVLVARGLAILGQNEWRREMGERRLVVWLAKSAAEAAKDRSAVELLVLVEHDQSIDIPGLAGMKDDCLSALILDPRHRLVDRMAAAQVLVGPRYGNDRMPKISERTPTALFRLMVESGMTRWGLYVAAKTASRVRDAMFVSMPVIDAWLRTGHPVMVDGPDIPRPMIGDVLGAAYDKYTRLGLRAIDRFAAEAVEVQQFVQAVKPPKRRYAAGVGVFLAEGGVLARRVVYSEESEAAYRWVRSPERMHWMPRELAIEYLDAVRRNLGYLNAIRHELVSAGTSGPSVGAPAGLRWTSQR